MLAKTTSCLWLFSFFFFLILLQLVQVDFIIFIKKLRWELRINIQKILALIASDWKKRHNKVNISKSCIKYLCLPTPQVPSWWSITLETIGLRVSKFWNKKQQKKLRSREKDKISSFLKKIIKPATTIKEWNGHENKKKDKKTVELWVKLKIPRHFAAVSWDFLNILANIPWNF